MKKVTISGVNGKSAAGGVRKKLTELLKFINGVNGNASNRYGTYIRSI
ncbi:hypothetical protein HMPREF9628_00484 [Peptoanaerobacter stomatis]|uniref:Uncharacterized protein n=1 Tax=Peptoanaerobacter stomatis TaxID=796937 RepID=G9XEE0_9FIRM|nr:hypothetical protein [Peptoanaerobacter stomatis]EHL18798.1 hypothetical protein HMPREF9628_00484 [Peptoanaerobacter stomatis]